MRAVEPEGFFCDSLSADQADQAVHVIRRQQHARRAQIYLVDQGLPKGGRVGGLKVVKADDPDLHRGCSLITELWGKR